jgi:hypothetical protein
MIERSVNYVNMPQKILSVSQRYKLSVLCLTLWKNGCNVLLCMKIIFFLDLENLFHYLSISVNATVSYNWIFVINISYNWN